MFLLPRIEVTEEEAKRIESICVLAGISMDEYFTVALHNFIGESITTQTAFLQSYAVGEFYPLMLVINEMDLCKITALGIYLENEGNDNESYSTH